MLQQFEIVPKVIFLKRIQFLLAVLLIIIGGTAKSKKLSICFALIISKSLPITRSSFHSSTALYELYGFSKYWGITSDILRKVSFQQMSNCIKVCIPCLFYSTLESV